MTTPSPFDQFFAQTSADSAFSKTLEAKLPPKERLTLTDELRAHEAAMSASMAELENLTKAFVTPEATAAGEQATDPSKPAPKAGTDPSKQLWDPKSGDTPTLQVQRFVRKEWKPFGFEAIAGMDPLKQELRESFIEPLRFKFLIEKLRAESTQTSVENADTSEIEMSPERRDALLSLYAHYEKFQISIPTGLLFYGPPGTGKTYITKKLAEELGAGFISKSVGEFGSSYLHQTSKNIREFFAWAKAASATEPIILFLDEIDSLVSARTSQVDANKAEEVSQFLQEINDLSKAPNLILIAATNRPDHLDSALLRSGRLDKKFYIGPPDTAAREALFRMHTQRIGRPIGKLDFVVLAEVTEGYVSADIEAICDEVARDASRDILESALAISQGWDLPAEASKWKITMKDLRKTILETPSSLANVDMKLYDSWRAAQGVIS